MSLFIHLENANGLAK